MFHSIAVTTDFSQFSRKPFGAAAELARRFNAQLHLVHVVREPELFTPWQVLATEPEGVRNRQVAAQRDSKICRRASRRSTGSRCTHRPSWESLLALYVSFGSTRASICSSCPPTDTLEPSISRWEALRRRSCSLFPVPYSSSGIRKYQGESHSGHGSPRPGDSQGGWR